MCVLAPVWADIAGADPNVGDPSETITVGGENVNVVSTFGVPIGPTWRSQFLLGSDAAGRDVAVRALYGGRNSLEIGLIASLISLVGGVVLGVLSGYFRGLVDAGIARVLDIIWAYPATLLGIALGVALAVGGLNLGFVTIEGGSNLIPALVIGVVYIPYIARPVRGEVMTLRQSEFIDAARMLGYSPFRIIVREVLPNLSTVVIPFVALQFAQAIVLEASLSFLGAGVQAPNASWGTMLAEGVEWLGSGEAVHLTLVPCVFLLVTVFAANLIGQRVQLAFDPAAASRRR
jgi:peptide/nickel transport system permease protein